MSANPALAYKILTGAQMTDFLAKERFAGAPVDLADGFIHLSTAEQVAGTLDKHFAGQDGLWIAAVDLGLVGDTVKWEVSRGGALFPHIYAELSLSAVVARAPLTRDAAGLPVIPA